MSSDRIDSAASGEDSDMSIGSLAIDALPWMCISLCVSCKENISFLRDVVARLSLFPSIRAYPCPLLSRHSSLLTLELSLIAALFKPHSYCPFFALSHVATRSSASPGSNDASSEKEQV